MAERISAREAEEREKNPLYNFLLDAGEAIGYGKKGLAPWEIDKETGTNALGDTVVYSGKNEQQLTSEQNQAATKAAYVANNQLNGKSSITLNPETGKITVKAPSMALKNEAFIKALQPSLEAISKAYKVNPNANYAMINDSDETKTAQGWLEDINKDLDSLVSEAVGKETYKSQVKAQTGLDYSDEDVTTRMTVATEYRDADGNTVSVNDDTLQALPAKIKNMNLFKNLEGWDETTQTVSYGNLMKKWKRDMNDSDILDVANEVNAYFENGEFTDTKEHAAMSAFRDFINRQDPDISFWGGAAEAIGQAIYGAITGLGTFWAEAFANLETVFNQAGEFGYELGREASGKESGTGEYKKENFWNGEVLPALEDWKKQNAEDLRVLSDTSANLYSTVDAIAPIGFELLASIGLGNAAAAATSSKVSKIASSIMNKYGAKAEKAAEVAKTLGSSADDLASLGAKAESVAVADVAGVAGDISKVSGEVAGLSSSSLTLPKIAAGAVDMKNVVANLYAGTDIIMRLQSGANFAKIANTAIKTSAALQKVGGVTSKISDVTAQIVTDVILSDPKMFRQLMETGDDEARAYALEQVTMNAVGEVAGVGLAKTISGIGTSEVGQVLNAKFSPKIYRLETGMGQVADNLKTIIHGGDAEWLANKVTRLNNDAKLAESASGISTWTKNRAWNKASKAERQLRNLAERRILRQAGKEFADFATENPVTMGRWEDVVASSRKINSKKAELIAEANNRINAVYKNDVSSLVAKFMQDDPNLKGARDAFLESQAKVIQIENSLGLGKNAKYFDLEQIDRSKKGWKKAVSSTRVLDNATNQYVMAGYRINTAKAIAEYSSIPDNVARAKKELAYFEQVTKEFEATAPQELLDAAKDLRQKAIDFSERTQQLRVDQRVMSFRELDRMKKSGYFEEGYMRTQRIKNLEDSFNRYYDMGAIKVPELRDTQSFVLGSQDDFQDVAAVLVDDLNEVARQVNRKKAMDMLREIGMPVKTVVSGDQTRLVSEVNKKAKDKFIKDVRANTDTIVKNSDSSIYADFFSHKQARAAVEGAEQSVSEAKAALGAAEKGTPKATTREARAIISSEIDEDLAQSIIEEKIGHPIHDMSEKQFNEFWKKADNTVKKKFTDALGLDGDITYKEYNTALHDNPTPLVNAEGDIAKTMVVRNYDDVWDYGVDGNNMDTLRNHVDNMKRNQEIFNRQTIYKDNLEKLDNLRKEYNIEGLAENVDRSVDDFIDGAIDTNKGNKTIDEVADSMSYSDPSVSKDDLIDYSTLESLFKNRKEVSSNFYAQAKKEYSRQLREQYREKFKDNKAELDKALKKVDKIAKDMANESSEILVSRIEQRYGEISRRLIDQGSSIPNQKYFFEHVDKLNKEITGVAQGPSVVKTYDNNGYAEYVELSPTVASMFTTMPRPLRMGGFGAMQQELCGLFRWGTTGGPWPGNLLRQGFRDTGNALVGGDAFRNRASVEDELTKLFGAEFAKEYQETVPGVYDTLLGQARESGDSVERLIVRRELERGGMNIEPELESNLYKFSRESKRAQMGKFGTYEKTNLGRTREALEKARNKSNILNDARETALRKRTYNNALLSAMKQGMSVQDARKYAEFIQSEATTNFVRQSYHLANLSQTVPYLGSAINGKKSFWRLMAFDPAGMSTRIVGGYVVPVIALTNMTLSNEEDKRIYKQIPEYQKKDSLVFVLNGQIISIPIPQEIGSFVAPVQHAIETVQGVSGNSYAELAANDLLGSFPVDLSGFVNIDSLSLLEEDVVTHNLIPGVAKAASSLLDPLSKSVVMYATGIDPYTMKKINRSDVNIDSTTGEQYIMDDGTSDFAKLVGNLMGDLMSADMAQKFIDNICGKGGSMIIDGVSKLAASVTGPDAGWGKIGASISSIGESVVKNATDTLTVARYKEESNYAWSRTTRQLFSEKEELLSGNTDASRQYLKDLDIIKRGEASEDKINEAKSRVRTVEQNFMQKVLDASNNLITKFDGTFDRYKFATTLSLMNLSQGEVNTLPYNKYASYISQEEFYINRAAAAETMARMGFSAPNDGSIFGYYKQNNDGTVTVKYSSPMSILNYSLSSQQQNQIALATVRELISDAGLWDKKKAVDAQVDAIYSSKPKMSNADYNQIDNIYIDWNAEVMSTLAPYISERTPEAVINSDVIDLIDGLIKVPGAYKVDKRGRHVTNNTLGAGSANDAYVKNYIRNIFKVNNSGVKGGKNYSGRD